MHKRQRTYAKGRAVRVLVASTNWKINYILKEIRRLDLKFA